MTELPLTPQVFHILLALADGDRHGYGIIQDVEAGTGGAIRLGPGTLYGALKRLVRAGLVRETARRPARDQDDERRRYYALTEAGRRLLSTESRRLADAVGRARRAGLLKTRPAD
ncbi:MAG: PadR family transcriptional regulator [Gemmatimonadales bacterium]